MRLQDGMEEGNKDENRKRLRKCTIRDNLERESWKVWEKVKGKIKI